jgi:single-strand DNA-binding protein
MSEVTDTVMRASVHHFVGRMGADPEIKYLNGGTVVATGRMAVNRLGVQRGQDVPPDWFTVEVWGDKAQGFVDTCRKGCQIQVMGRVKSNRWTDRNNVQRLDLIIQADAVQFIAPPRDQQQAPPVQQQAPAPAGYAPAPAQAPAGYAQPPAGYQQPAPQQAPAGWGYQQQAPAPAPAPAPQGPPSADDVPF